MKRVIAAAQFTPYPGDIVKNSRIAQQLCLEAAMSGANLVVLPELCLSGEPSSRALAANWAQQKDGTFTDSMLSIARERNILIAFGFIELAYGNLYNSSLLVGPNGILANARKKNLRGSDFLWADAGQLGSPSVITPIGRIGLLIGDDCENSARLQQDNSKFYPRGSVDVICLSTNDRGHGDFPAIPWVYLAKTTGANVVVANAHSTSLVGSSCVIDRDAQAIWTAPGTDTLFIVGGYGSL